MFMRSNSWVIVNKIRGLLRVLRVMLHKKSDYAKFVLRLTLP